MRLPLTEYEIELLVMNLQLAQSATANMLIDSICKRAGKVHPHWFAPGPIERQVVANKRQ